jgi:hypothetical protein
MFRVCLGATSVTLMIAHARKRRWSITAGILRSERQHSGILNLMTACAKKAVEIRSVLAMADSTLPDKKRLEGK